MFAKERTLEHREYHRVAFSQGIRFECNQHNKSGGCLAYNISEGGIQISLAEFVPLNTPVRLRVKLNPMSQICEQMGRVVWSKRIPYSEKYSVGLEFSQITPRLKQEIQSYIKSH